MYKPFKYVPPQRVGFLHRFGLKTSIDFVHFGLESGMVFEETTGVYENIYRLKVNKEERLCENFFCWHSNLSNDDIIF